jgi:hypothetical protein
MAFRFGMQRLSRLTQIPFKDRKITADPSFFLILKYL